MTDQQATVASAERSPQRNFGRHMTLVAAANFATPVSGVLTLPLLAAGLGVVGRGDVAAGTAPLLFAVIGFTFGIPETVTYFVARHPGMRRSVFRRASSAMAVVGVLLTAALILLAPVIAPHSAHERHLIILSSIALLPSLLVVVLRADAAARGQWGRVAGEQVIVAAGRAVCLGGLYVVGALNITTATIVLAGVPVLGALAYVRFRPLDEPTASLVDVANNAQMYSYGLRIWIGAVSGIMLARLDQFLMTPLSSARELGLYAVAAGVSEVSIVVSNAVRDVTFATDASDPSNSRLERTARISWAVSVFIAICIAAPAHWWMPLVFGQNFSGAVPSCIILVLGLAMCTPGSVGGAAISSRGRPGARSAVLTVASLINVVLLFVLVPKYGALGASISTVIGSGIACFIATVLLRRFFGISMTSIFGLHRNDVALMRMAVSQRLNKSRHPSPAIGATQTPVADPMDHSF